MTRVPSRVAAMGSSLLTREAPCVPIAPAAPSVFSPTQCLFISLVSGVLVSGRGGGFSLVFNAFQELSPY